jgi:putative transposase
MTFDPKDPDSKNSVALFRYRLIADALELEGEAQKPLLAEAAKRDHLTPWGERLQVSERTLERWVKRFRAGGLPALLRTVRKDKGHPRRMTAAIVDRAIQLRQEQPNRSTETLIDILERDGKVAKGALHRSTLDRHLDRAGQSRRMLHVAGTKRHVRLWSDHPLDFVVADFHAGPYIRTDTGEIRRAELGAFIDHCSRYVPESRYGLSENWMAVRKGLSALVLGHGPPVKLYTDNGPGYQAGRFHFACDQLGIKLVHSKPYVSEGRGVIERFNRTVKEAFEAEVRRLDREPTLEELNQLWRAWLGERYHHRVHSETKEEPSERFHRLMEQTQVRRIDPQVLDEVLRIQARRKVHPKTSTVEVGGVPFVVDTALRKRRVCVLYDPHDLTSVLIYLEGRRIQRAFPQQKGEPPVPAPVVPKPPSMSVDYLDLLRRDHAARRLAETSTLRFRSVQDPSVGITLPLLIERLQTCTKRPLGSVEQQTAAAVLHSLCPIEVAVCDIALKIAVATLGPGLHASLYLEALREHVILARKKGQP